MEKSNKDWGLIAMGIKAGLLIAVLLYAVVGAFLYFFQCALIYPGSAMYRGQSLDDPKTTALMQEIQLELWHDPQGGFLGYRREDPKAAEAWLIFYGNGDHAARSADYFLRLLPDNLPGRAMSYFVMEYPGYGPRPGASMQESIVQAGGEAFAFVHQTYPTVYLLGQSLGAGVAAQVVGQAPGEVAGLVLLTPFDRMASAAQAQVGTWLGPVGILYPVGWFLSETYDSVKALSRYRNPLVVISGGQDTLTTAAAGRRLAEQAGENGRFWVQEENGHWANITPVPQCRELFAFATGVPVKEVEP